MRYMALFVVEGKVEFDVVMVVDRRRPSTTARLSELVRTQLT